MDAPPSTQSSSGEALLVHYWHILKKRRWVVALFTGLLVVTVGVATSLSTRYYAATAVIEISPKADRVIEVDEVSEFVQASSSSELRNYYATQYKIMQSRSVIEEALRILKEQHGVTDFDDAEKPVDAFRALLSVSPVVETHLVNITVEYPDPQKAALFADVLAEAYMKSNLDRALESTRSALDWLRDQQEAFKVKKYESDVKVHEFRSKNGLVGAEDQRSGIQARLNTVTEAWNAASTERVQIEAVHAELSRLQAAGEWASLARHFSAEDAVLRELLTRLEVTTQERSRLAARVKGQHPEWIAVNAELDSITAQIRAQVEELLVAHRAKTDLVIRREEALAAELADVRTEAAALEKKLIDLKFLEAEALRNEALFQSVDRRTSEVDLTALMRNNNIRRVDVAVPSDNPVRPKLAINLAMALVLGLLGGCALAFAIEMLDTTVKSREDIESVIGNSLLGVVPALDPLDLKAMRTETDRHLFVYARPRSNVAECLRSVRANVLFRLPQKPVRTLLITSAAPMEGKSFTSSNLSAIIAMTGSRVLLIDADLRRPSLHKRFGLANDLGLANLLLGESSSEEVIRPTHVPGLDIVVAGPPPANPGELLGSGPMQRALKSFRGYDFIIVDSPPVNIVADPLVLSSQVDGVLVVVEANRTSKTMVAQASARLREVNAPVLGAIVNKLNMATAGYGYNYYDTYGYYYTEAEAEADRAAGGGRA